MDMPLAADSQWSYSDEPAEDGTDKTQKHVELSKSGKRKWLADSAV